MRYFVNKLPDFVPGAAVHIDTARWRDTVLQTLDAIVRHMPPTVDHCDGGLYVGCAGVAYAFYHVASSDPFADRRTPLLQTAKDYSDVALGYSMLKKSRDAPTAFLLGNAGVLAVSSLICDALEQRDVGADLARRYQELAPACVPVNFAKSGSDELFVGRAGYICGSLLLNRHYQQQVISQDITTALCRSMIQSGRDYARRHTSICPLMYAYYKQEYLGAAHGLASILLMLLSCPQFLASDPLAQQDVQGSVEFMLSLMQPNGNIPPAMDEVGRGSRATEDELVHWCHGAPGVVYLFAKAYLYYKDERYLNACLLCGELTWKQGLLLKGPGICHGVAGSGYVFLLLYRLTRDPRHYHRALQFAEFIQSPAFKAKARTPDTPYSLYEGLAGTVCFLTDLMQPHRAQLPFFDIFS